MSINLVHSDVVNILEMLRSEMYSGLCLSFSACWKSSVWSSGDQRCNNICFFLTGTIMLFLQPVKTAVPCEMVSQMQKLHPLKGRNPQSLTPHLCLSLSVCGCVFLLLAWFWPQQLSDTSLSFSLLRPQVVWPNIFLPLSKVLWVSEGFNEQEGGRSMCSWEIGEMQLVWQRNYGFGCLSVCSPSTKHLILKFSNMISLGI